jgi:Lysozyme like domain
VANGEPDLAAGSVTPPGGGFRTGNKRRTVAGTLAQKVTVEGWRTLTREATGFLSALKNIRTEMREINQLARGPGGGTATGGTGQGTPTGAAGTTMAPAGGQGLFGGFTGGIARMAMGAMAGGGGWGGQGTNVRGPGGFNFGGAMAVGAGVAQAGVNVITDRFQRNVLQSAPISAQDVLTAAMYGTQYRGAEMARYGVIGPYGGRREDVLAAERIGLGFGGLPGQIRAPGGYLAHIGAVTQAFGGTITSAQAAATTGLFAGPMISTRAQMLGITPYKVQGRLQNPLTVAMEYVKDYEKRNNVQMNEVDFANLQAPGSAHRLRMKQIYGLSDEAIDMVIQAGMQNMQFRTRTGRAINFSSETDINRIVERTSLGMTAARFGTVEQRREARFFERQEGAMTDRLEWEMKLQETLADVEDAFSGLLGPLHEFERVIKLITGGVGMFGAGMMLGGGRGILGTIFGGGGGPTGAPIPGAPIPGGGLGGMGLLRGGLGMAGIGLTAYGVGQGMGAKDRGDVASSVLSMTAGGAALGTAIMPGWGTAIGAGVGLTAGTAISAISYFKNVDRTKVKDGYEEGVGMDDKTLIASIGDYIRNAEWGGRGEGAGPKQRGRHDAFARRRGALLAAALDDAISTGALKITGTSEGADLRELVDFFSSDAVFDDGKLWSNKDKAKKYIDRINTSASWRKFFGSVSDPFAYTPVTTDESKSLIMTGEQVYGGGAPTGGGPQSGDAVFAKVDDGHSRWSMLRQARRDPFPGGGDAIEDKAVAKGDTWNLLDSRMKARLLQLFRASGGRVWLGNGWRSEQQQRDMFLSRHVQDPNGDIEWNGQRWRHVSGAPAAPPGRSFHEIGLAADLEGDIGWMNANVAAFQLRHFADVNNEPWHVQLVELPTGREPGVDYGTGTGGATPGAPGAAAAPQAFGGGGGGGLSGIGYSMSAAAQATHAPGMVGGGGTPPGAPGVPGAGASVPGAGVLSWEDVVKVAYAAGFRGSALQTMVAITEPESGRNPRAHNPNPPDDSYGLWQINMLGSMGPDRARQWGLDPNAPYDELYDPNVNARAAWDLSGGGTNFRPWSTYNRSDYQQYMDEARAAMTATGLGDGPFFPGNLSMTSPGGSANVNITVQINSTGNVRYDAEALGEAVRPVLSNVMAEISTKRGS